MKVLFVLLAVVVLCGCASPRYDLKIIGVPTADRSADPWVAIRVDKVTGETWQYEKQWGKTNEGKPMVTGYYWKSLGLPENQE